MMKSSSRKSATRLLQIASDWTPNRPTQLIQLTPNGLGTAHVQSFQSYLEHLAIVHNSSWPRWMLTQLMEQTGSSIAFMHYSERHFYERPSHYLPYVGMFEAQTGRDDLRQLTFSSMDDAISLADWISDKRRYCAHCMDDDARAERYPYERLIWKIRSVTCCPIHGTALSDVNTKCIEPSTRSKKLRVFGFCNNCGSIGYRCRLRDSTTPTDAELHLSRLWEEFLAELPVAGCPKIATIRSSLSKIVDFYGGRGRLAKQCGWSKQNIRDQLTISKRIHIRYLESICLQTGLSLKQVIYDPTSADSLGTPLRFEATTAYRGINKSLRLMKIATSAPTVTAKDVRDVTRQSATQLRRIDAYLYDRLAAREKLFLLAHQRATIELKFREVTESIISLLKDGVGFNYRELLRRMSASPGDQRGLIGQIIFNAAFEKKRHIHPKHKIVLAYSPEYVKDAVLKIRSEIPPELFKAPVPLSKRRI